MKLNALPAISFNIVLFSLAMIITPLATFAPVFQFIHSMGALVGVFWLASLAGGFALSAWALRQHPVPFQLASAIAIAATLAACIHICVSYLQEISAYPLTLTWSEASRYYYASLFFSKQIYGEVAPPTVLHPSRYLLQAIPFLIPNSPLWLHRAWQAFLWLALPAAASVLLARRLATAISYRKWLLTGAFFLYLFIGPVYYHLIVPVIAIVWGFDTRLDTPRRRWVSLATLLFASAWSGISRVNWFPAAGLLASALFIMERPIPNGSSLTRSTPQPNAGALLPLDHAAWAYFLRPVGWTLLSTLAAFLTQIGYIAWSGNSAEQFTTSFFSDLLWHRLLPNATYPPGLLLAAAMVSLPPALILTGKLLAASNSVPFIRRVHLLRLLALATIVGVLLAGGLLVSLKIGGGSNLHNIDAYMVLLGVITAYFAFDQVVPDLEDDHFTMNARPVGRQLGSRVFQAGLVTLFAFVTAFAVLPRGPVEPLPAENAANETLNAIIEAAEYVHSQGQETLFIGQRHLLTFHFLRHIPLVPDYERVFLMEAAMANDEGYLQRFYDDLKRQRYGLIVSEPLSKQMKDPLGSFAAENNAWVKRVSRQVLCYYEPVKTFLPTQVQLLAPRASPESNCR